MEKKGQKRITVNRDRLLRTLMDRDVSLSTMEEMTRPLAGKTEEEKEIMAKEILERFLAEHPS